MISNPRKVTKMMPVVAMMPLAPAGAKGRRLSGSTKNIDMAMKMTITTTSAPIIRFWARLDSSVP